MTKAMSHRTIRIRALIRVASCVAFLAWMPQPEATAQTAAPASAPTLQVGGDLATPLSLSPAALKELPRTNVGYAQDSKVTPGGER